MSNESMLPDADAESDPEAEGPALPGDADEPDLEPEGARPPPTDSDASLLDLDLEPEESDEPVRSVAPAGALSPPDVTAAPEEPDPPDVPSEPEPLELPEAPVDPNEFEHPGGLLSRIDGHVLLYHDPHGLQAEQYRSFRANLVAMNPSGAPWAIVVTSARKGEGKSVGAANLAACLAELPGSRVCLVDADTRSPSQAALFGLEPRAGLTDMLSGQASLLEITLSTVLPGLDCIHAGAEPANPAELLGGEPFAQLLVELRRRYSWIVLDAPPVNPFTDPCVVAARCEGAVMVVRLQSAPRELVAASVDAIRHAGGKLLGSFVTGVTPDADDLELAGETGLSSEDRSLLRRRGAGDRAARRKQRAQRKAEKVAWRKLRRTRASDDRDDDHPV